MNWTALMKIWKNIMLGIFPLCHNTQSKLNEMNEPSTLSELNDLYKLHEVNEQNELTWRYQMNSWVNKCRAFPLMSQYKNRGSSAPATHRSESSVRSKQFTARNLPIHISPKKKGGHFPFVFNFKNVRVLRIRGKLKLLLAFTLRSSNKAKARRLSLFPR